MDWLAIRQEFSATDQWVYLDSASIGPLPDRSAKAGADFLADAQKNARSPDLWRQGLDEARQAFAQLIGSKASNLAFTKNATEGVNIIANGVSAEPGDNVVLCGALEHPANIAPWLALKQRGVELRLVAPDSQAIPSLGMAAAIDSRTRAVAVSTVSFMPGFRTDLAPIADAANRVGALLLVDATQSAGVLRTDVVEMQVDALVTSTHKYLLGLYGQGFLYVSPEWAARLIPVSVGAAGYRDPETHPAAANFEWEQAEGARRFETGHSYASAAIVAASLNLLNEIGPDRVEARTCGLAMALARGLTEMGWPVNCDPYGHPQSQIVTVGAISPGNLYAVADPDLQRLHAALNEARIRHSARRSALRFSFHLFNDDTDVTKTLEIAESVRKKVPLS